MNQDLNRAELDEAIKLGEKSLQKYKSNPGKKYDNNLNSHVKGRLGEFALEKWLTNQKIAAISHFQNDISDQLCDIEIPSAKSFKRVEIKPGRCSFGRNGAGASL